MATNTALSALAKITQLLGQKQTRSKWHN